MKTTFAILTAICLVAAGRGARGQETLGGPFDADMGSLPPMGSMELPAEESLPQMGEELGDGVSPAPIPMSEGGGLMESYESIGCAGEDCYGMGPLLQSSGSWLRRGYWYGEADFCLLNRQWDRHGLVLMFERVNGSFPDFNPLLSNGNIIVLNQLRAAGGEPGENGLVRATFGRFLFRDDRNRDHAMEMTYLGGGAFKQSNRLSTTAAAGLTTSDLIATTARGFDGAQSSNFDFENEIQSLELNYEVKQRMQRDQMILQPNGEWVRAANPSRTYSFLVGGRLMEVDEELNWTASRINVGTAAAPDIRDDDFFNNTETSNTLLGTQIGGSGTYETARWSIGVSAKAGSYWNNERMRHAFVAPDTTTPANNSTGNVALRDDGFAFVAETELLGKWHLRPNLSLRAGLEFMHVSGIALAPHQVDFIPGGQPFIADSGFSTYMGTAIGLEWYR